MVIRVEPNYACLFFGYVQQQISRQYTGFIPQLHKRQIDDIVGAASCRREELEAIIDFVSNFHPALQFTSTITPLSFTRKQTLTTSISLLFILTTASVLSLTASSSACVDFAPTTMTSCLNLGMWQHSLYSVVIRVLPLIEYDLRRVTTISRPDALSGSRMMEPFIECFSSFVFCGVLQILGWILGIFGRR